jgi:lipoyl(octanoyl) transferase
MRFLSLRYGGSTLVPYERVWEFQKKLVEKRAEGEIPDTFVFVEHPSVVTRGRGLQRKADQQPGLEPRAMPFAPPSGVEYHEIERGGDLTWHGPGQLVIYPIVKLDGVGFGPLHDISAYLRKLETLLGSWLQSQGLQVGTDPDATGIWVRDSGACDGGGVDRLLHGAPSIIERRKIASIGIAIRKWVTYHGVGMNLTNDLGPYRMISPCGFSPEVMTSLARESEGFAALGWNETVRTSVEESLARHLAEGVLGLHSSPEIKTLDLKS